MYARTRPLPTKPARPLWPWVLLFLALSSLAYFGYSTLTRPRNPPVQASAATLTPAQQWQTLKTFGPRPVGEAGHDQALNWLEGQFTALGYHVTRQAVTVERPFDLGARLQTANGTVIPVTTLYGVGSGEQRAELLRIPPQATLEQLQALGLQAKIALTTCPGEQWRPLVERAISAGAFGVVAIDDCPVRRLQKVGSTPLPLVRANAQEKARLLALAGQTVTLTTRVEMREVTGHNLVAARVNSRPDIIYGAHLDTVNGALGANDNSSGVLAVLEAARQAAGTALAEQAWFVLFDAEEDGTLGSRAFVKGFSYPLHGTRAMLNFDMVGVNAEPLGVAIDPELQPLAQKLRPDIRVFDDEPLDTRETFGRTARLTGRSDHVQFKVIRVRTVFLHRGTDVNYHAPSDLALQPALVQDAADFAVQLGQATLQAPWNPDETCRNTGRNC